MSEKPIDSTDRVGAPEQKPVNLFKGGLPSISRVLRRALSKALAAIFKLTTVKFNIRSPYYRRYSRVEKEPFGTSVFRRSNPKWYG